MRQAEFHRVYQCMPSTVKAELVAGTVYVSSPLSRAHGNSHVRLTLLLGTYAVRTPGLECLDNTTVILSDEDEVQPDLSLLIAPECGGQAQHMIDDYVSGAPELVAEVARSSRAIDLHGKRERYRLTGVKEYIVLCLRPKILFWFDLQAGCELKADEKSVLRSIIFPGLWLHAEALVNLDHSKAAATLDAGMSSPEYHAFAAKLAASPKY